MRSESACKGVLYKKKFIKRSQNSQENTCATFSFLKKFLIQTLFKKRHCHRCFPVNFVKSLRTTFLQDTFGRLLTRVLYIMWIFLRYTCYWFQNQHSTCFLKSVLNIPENSLKKKACGGVFFLEAYLVKAIQQFYLTELYQLRFTGWLFLPFVLF